MNLKYKYGLLSELSDRTLVIFTPSFDKLTDASLKLLNESSSGALATMMNSGEFTGACRQITTLTNPTDLDCDRVILLGLGSKDEINADSYRVAVGNLSRLSSFVAYESATFVLNELNDPGCFQAIIEGYLLGSHELLDFKSGKKTDGDNQIQTLTFAVSNRRMLPRLQKAIERGQVMGEGQTMVRRLAETPANYLTPKIFAQHARKLARKHDNLSCRVMDKKSLERAKMGAYLAVSQGSLEPPRFVVLDYKGGKAGQKPVVLVGKGITFDAGGISLKKAEGMQEMKGDMTGAAVVMTAMDCIARLGLKLNVVGLTPLAENLPSGNAYKPGDVITSRKGHTIEIINTDAEGRLILADALDYANEFDPQAVIDIATLTGGALYVLGYSGAPIMGNNSKLMDRLREASEATAERVWEMPIWDDFRKLMKSSIADLKNSGGKAAPTMTAGAFLENFIGDWPWAHVDIAYVDVEPSGRPYIPKGTTGIGLRLLVEMLSRWKKL